MNQTPHGIIVPLVTPFDAQQNVDETALRRIINHVIEGGVHGVFVAGTTSEFYALSPEEHSELFQLQWMRCMAVYRSMPGRRA